MTLRSIVFTAARTGRLSHHDLLTLLPVERAANAAVGLTGILVLNDDNVLGIAEGPEDVVRARVDAVKADPHNVNVQVLVDDPIPKRAFADWQIGFPTDDPAVVATPGFVDLFSDDRPDNPAAAVSRSVALLEWFLRTPPAQLTAPPASTSDQERIVRATIEVLRDVGPARCTLELISRRTAMPVDEVQQHFATVGLLLAAALARWIDDVATPLAPIAHSDGAVAYLRALVREFAEEPALDRLIMAALATSADPGDPAGEAFLLSYRAFHANLREALVADVAAGREPATMEPVNAAKQLMAVFDGLRIQNLFDPDPDLPATFERAVDRLRTGWSTPYRA